MTENWVSGLLRPAAFYPDGIIKIERDPETARLLGINQVGKPVRAWTQVEVHIAGETYRPRTSSEERH